jgi:dienelactone hydrolase
MGGRGGQMFHRFCRDWLARVAPENPVPKTPQEWIRIRDARRAWLRQAMGIGQEDRCPLEPHVTGTEDRGDYVLEKVLLRSRPNLVMTTHLYVPKKVAKPAPAVLSVHGHWAWGKLEPAVQARNIGMAKLGFVVLCVDAIGSSERAYRGETYHGRQLGAQALPAGLTLAGLQVWDNSRALDYLCSRPEVDPRRIACTGASGGCNQTIYLAALDERVAAAAPVCCVGSLRGYLNGPHCVCEMVPGILQVAEMGDVLALIAPRPLVIINGIHDGGAGFQVDDMRAQFPKLKQVYELLGAGDKLAKSEIDLGHGYYPAMREVMYAWFRRWLQGVQADLCPEPQTDPVDPKRLWCFPEAKMPEGFANVPSLAFEEGRRLAATYPSPTELAGSKEARRALVSKIEQVLGGFPRGVEPRAEPASLDHEGFRGVVVTTEPGIEVPMILSGDPKASSCLLWLSVKGKSHALQDAELRRLLREGKPVAVPDLRGLGETTWARANTAGVWDYQLFQNGTMMGRPVLGMWVWDALQCIRVLRRTFSRVSIFGNGVMALVALFAAAFDEEVESVACDELLASYVHPAGFSREYPMCTFVPNLLKVADVPQIAALVAPRPLRILRALDGGRRPVIVDATSGS